MDPAGTVRVGLRKVELRSFLGILRPGSTPERVAVVGDQGKVYEVYEDTWVKAKPDEHLLFVQGTSKSREWEQLNIDTAIASFNLDTGDGEVNRKAIARLAAPPFHNFFGILSLFVALFSLLGMAFGSPKGFVFIVPSAGYLLWVWLRVRKMYRAVVAVRTNFLK